MTKQARFLIIAVLLTLLDVALVICCGWQVWTAWSGDVWNRALSVLLATLGGISLANVWAQVVPARIVLPGDRSGDCEQTAAQIPIEARGQADV